MHLTVGIDITPILNRVPRGIGNYIYELIFHMENVNYLHFFKISRLKYPRRLKRLWGTPIPFFEVSGRSIFLKKFQIFHGTDNYIPPESGFPRVLTVHDVYPLIDSPEGKIARKIRRAMERKPERIILISGFSRKEFLRYFPEYAERSHVVYHGVSDFWRPVDRETLGKDLGKFGIKGPYIFYAGDTDKRKNVENLLKALSRMKNLTLVMAGGFLKEHQIELLKKLGAESSVIQTGYVTREELRSLYSGALLFVFPSKYEGFGLPLLEAMKCGTPVVASDIEIFREIADGAFYPVDPESPESIKEGIENVLNDPDLRERLIAKGNEVSGKFTWSETAKNTLQVYNLALSDGKAE